MDRFERRKRRAKFNDSENLHSNMDRFESSSINLPAADGNKIYIPIWIDLKVGGQTINGIAIQDLHSNMDRFER